MERGPDLPSSSAAAGDTHSTDPWATITRRLSVLQMIPDLSPSGPARAAVDIASGVMAAGGRAVVVSGGGRLLADLLRCGATHVEMPLASDNALGRWASGRRLSKLMLDHRISIIHAHGPGAAAIARKLAGETGAAYTLTCHGLYSEEEFAGLRQNGVLDGARRVIAVSETVAEHLMRHHPLPSGQPPVVTPGIDIPRFDPARISAERIIQLAQAWRLPDGPPVIMLPGHFSRSRGHGELIEALELMRDHDFHCVFAAETPASQAYGRELAALARRHGIEGRLLIGDDCRDMPAAYMLADVVIYARANGAGFARVVAEAQAMGRPVVAYDTPLLLEQTGESPMTWLVPPGDRPALAQAICEALSLSAAERQALAPEAGALVRERYNRAASAAAMIEVFLGLILDAEAA